MTVIEITKIGKAKNCLVIPKFILIKLGWKEKDEVVIEKTETGIEIEKVK